MRKKKQQPQQNFKSSKLSRHNVTIEFSPVRYHRKSSPCQQELDCCSKRNRKQYPIKPNAIANPTSNQIAIKQLKNEELLNHISNTTVLMKTRLTPSPLHSDSIQPVHSTLYLNRLQVNSVQNRWNKIKIKGSKSAYPNTIETSTASEKSFIRQ